MYYNSYIFMDQPQNSAPITPVAENVQKTEHSNNTLMGILSYIGPLVIIPFLTTKEDPFVKFHIEQGLVLLVIEVAVWILGSFMWPFWMIASLINLGTFVLSVIGIINVTQGKQKELPLVGAWSKHIKI